MFAWLMLDLGRSSAKNCWNQRSLYPIAAPASPPPPHTPETAIFTRYQCRKCRTDNNPCPVHDHLNEKRQKRTASQRTVSESGGDVPEFSDDLDDENLESGVETALEDLVPAPKQGSLNHTGEIDLQFLFIKFLELFVLRLKIIYVNLNNIFLILHLF